MLCALIYWTAVTYFFNFWRREITLEAILELFWSVCRNWETKIQKNQPSLQSSLSLVWLAGSQSSSSLVGLVAMACLMMVWPGCCWRVICWPQAVIITVCSPPGFPTSLCPVARTTGAHWQCFLTVSTFAEDVIVTVVMTTFRSTSTKETSDHNHTTGAEYTFFSNWCNGVLYPWPHLSDKFWPRERVHVSWSNFSHFKPINLLITLFGSSR